MLAHWIIEGLPVNQDLAHSKKGRGKSPRRYNSRVQQPMWHVMALRVSKAVLVFASALFYTILVLNNITDYGSNYEFVRHVLLMDSTFPGNHLMWRAVNAPLVHTVFYIGIIAWESVTVLLCWLSDSFGSFGIDWPSSVWSYTRTRHD